MINSFKINDIFNTNMDIVIYLYGELFKIVNERIINGVNKDIKHGYQYFNNVEFIVNSTKEGKLFEYSIYPLIGYTDLSNNKKYTMGFNISYLTHSGYFKTKYLFNVTIAFTNINVISLKSCIENFNAIDVCQLEWESQ